MEGKVIGALAGAAFLLLVGVTVVVGGGAVATADAPTGGCAVSVTGAPAGPGTTAQASANLTADQMAAARTIVGVGKGMNIAERGTAIALGVAMQESTLNQNVVNGRSVGLFQQQGSLYADINRTDPADSSRGFYRVLLQRVPTYPLTGTFADIAQTVQAAGAGAAPYAKWESWATALANQLFSGTPARGVGNGTVTCKTGGGAGPIRVEVTGATVNVPAESGHTGQLQFPSANAAKAAAAALSYLGTTYAWGGGDANGPTKGQRDGGVADQHGDYNKIGFDCSGLTLYAWAQAQVTLPRTAREQQTAGTPGGWKLAKPGDLLFYGYPAHHVTLYLGKLDGKDYMVEAPQSGDVVKMSEVRTGGDFQSLVVSPLPS